MRPPRHALAIAVFIPLATLVIYAWGARLTPPGKSFLWMHALNTGDTYTYLSWVAQARDGHLLFRILFTAEACARLLFHPLFLAIGFTARVLSVPPIAAFHAARVLVGVALLIVLHRFFARRLSSVGVPPGAAALALLYAALGSGLGWAFVRPDVPALGLPVDLWMPEAILFLALLESPLFLASLLLALLILEWILPAGGRVRIGRPRDAACLLALTPLLGLTHPFEIVTIATTLVVAAALGRVLAIPLPSGFAKASAVFAAGAALAFAYVRVVLAADPVFAHWLAAAHSPSPPPAAYLIAFAPQLVLALLALPGVRERRATSDLLLIAWPVASALLLYSPLAQQRRFVAGVQIPLTALAVEGLLRGLPRALRRAGAPESLLALTRRWRVPLVTAFLAFSFVTNAVVVKADIEYFRRGEYPLYLEKDLLAALEAFRVRSSEDAILLASPAVSHFVPAIAGRRVVGGHSDLTVDAERKAEDVRRFFDPGTPTAERRAFLEHSRATHVLLSPYEAAYVERDPSPLARSDPDAFLGMEPALLGLSPVFRAGPVSLFEVAGRRASGE